MSVTSDAWPIYVPGVDGQPVDAILSHIATHGVYTVADTTERATLLTDLATAGADDTYIVVRRLDATAGKQLEFTMNGGTDWYVLAAEVADAAWSPSYTNITVGNGTVTAVYHERDGWVHAFWQIVLGSTSAVSGSIGVSLPVNAYSGYMVIGYADAFDTSAGTSFGAIVRANSLATTTAIDDAAGGGLWDNNTPISPWEPGDRISLTLHYKSA